MSSISLSHYCGSALYLSHYNQPWYACTTIWILRFLWKKKPLHVTIPMCVVVIDLTSPPTWFPYHYMQSCNNPTQCIHSIFHFKLTTAKTCRFSFDTCIFQLSVLGGVPQGRVRRGWRVVSLLFFHVVIICNSMYISMSEFRDQVKHGECCDVSLGEMKFLT